LGGGGVFSSSRTTLSTTHFFKTIFKTVYWNQVLSVIGWNFQGRKEVLQFFLSLVKEVITPVNTELYQDSVLKRPALTKKNLACYENALTHLNDYCFNIIHVSI
jgi:hypothetical protein